jgi:hypothetical protein
VRGAGHNMTSSAFDVAAVYARGQVVKLRLDGDLNLAELDLQRALGNIADAGGQRSSSTCSGVRFASVAVRSRLVYTGGCWRSARFHAPSPVVQVVPRTLDRADEEAFRDSTSSARLSTAIDQGIASR